ncbi:hypothetical protein LWI29_012961 [Acer saccharum]|uniref:Uncharacterized protein n=1 Tax=Acer saccharum TaxID=4024 RepID=A0AA39T4K9_ACESA|nr:hypothetical protein LWI29_012961 [Acer saccharum]
MSSASEEVSEEEPLESEELRCMYGRRSLGRGLHPPWEESSRVGRIAREVEEFPRQSLDMEGQEPMREDEAPPREELT